MGPYEILSALGAGGMGEVYRARDTRLERTVAIKVLPADLSSDPDRRERFDREARAISSLNHPHICILHDVGNQDGTSYLVMESLEGETLAAFAATGAVLAIHLSVHVLGKVIAELTPHYGADCPVAVVWRASWPDERIVRATLGTLEASLGAELERTAIILVGRTIEAKNFAESRLYAADYNRRYRPVGALPRFPEAT